MKGNVGLSVFSFSNISSDQTYHSNYGSKKVEDFANEKNIDFHQKIASNKTKLTASEPDIVLTENGKLPSEEYRESLTYAFLIENILLDHSQDKALENVCFFLSLFIKGDHRYCAFTFQELSLR